MAVPISFLSDYGHGDDFVGVCHGVIAAICPRATVVDLTHGVPRHELRPAALALRNALPYMPAGVHLAVVDPGVGGERRAVALRTAAESRVLVGPDNGVLSLACERFGGAVEAVDIGRSPFRLEPVSATFHGRDIFAPVAAHLAAGAPLADAGEQIDPATLARLELPRAALADGALVAHALYVDAFGNVQLDAGHDDLAAAGIARGRRVELESRVGLFPALLAQTFADVAPGELLLYEDGYRTLAVAVNRGDAARRLGLVPDAELRIAPA